MAVRIPDAFVSALLAGEKFVIFTHVRPDGDAVGSAFGLRSFLRDLGKSADVVLPDDPPARYAKLGTEGALRSADVVRYDTFVAVDCAVRPRIADGGALACLADESRFFDLDHHFTNSVKAPVYDFVDPKASSASEIVAALAFQSGKPVSCRTAEFLLSGMMTDTGGFKFSNTTGDVLRMAAKLLDSGAELEKLVNILFFSKPAKQLRFESDLAEQIKIVCGGKFAYAYVSPELLKKHDFSLKEDEGIIDILRGIDGVVIAMLVHRAPDGFKISLRSKDPRFPVSPSAARFGGGGHLMAAGATLDLPDFPSVEAAVLPLLPFDEKG